MRAWFRRQVLERRAVCFVVLGASFLAFGLGTLNLFFVARASLEFVFMHGWMALMDGAAMQLVELLVTAYLSMAAYVVFKACEHRLVHGLVKEET